MIDHKALGLVVGFAKRVLPKMVKAEVDLIPRPTDGRDGRDGLDGASGVAGKDGKAGRDGKNGPPGPRGMDGAQGVGFLFQGKYDPSMVYRGPGEGYLFYDVVEYAGSSYVAIGPYEHMAAPPNGGWALMASKGANGMGKIGGSRGPIDSRDIAAEKFSSVAATNVLAGQPVYVNSSAQVALAQGNTAGTSEVVGVASTNTAAGATCTWQKCGSVERMDWTSVLGVTALTPGEVYFVSPTMAGALTATAPIAAGQFVVQIGRAITAREMMIDVTAPVVL